LTREWTRENAFPKPPLTTKTTTTRRPRRISHREKVDHEGHRSVKDAVKNYTLGKVVVPALRGVTLEVGAEVHLMPPVGRGKTKLLNLIGCATRRRRRRRGPGKNTSQ